MDMTTRSQQAISHTVSTVNEGGNGSVHPLHLAIALLGDTERLPRPLA